MDAIRKTIKATQSTAVYKYNTYAAEKMRMR